jgi:oligopeptide transport system substrate-binding protein
MTALPLKASLGLTAVAVLLLSGCSAPAETAGGDAEIRVAIAEPDHLTPANHYEAYEVVMSTFSSLTALDENEELEYLQAESVESEDAVTWTITLRDGWTFHNGEAVTAESYVNAWNFAADPANAQVNSGQLKNIVGYAEMNPAEGETASATELTGLTVVDDLTFTVELINADRQFPLQLTPGQTGLYPLPEAAFDDPEGFDRMPIGNGPFMLSEAWVANQEIELVPFEEYEGPEPTVDGITFVPYLDTTIAYTDALAGTVDIVAISGDQITRAEADFGENFHALDAPGVDLLGFPSDDPRFADKRVRQAISMAIDREAINDAIFGGAQIPATSLTSPSMPGDPTGICGEYCEFDPEAAQALLAEAGGFEGTMELLFIGGWGQEDLFAAYANQIRQNLGLEDVVATPASDFAAFTDRVATGEVAGPFRARWGALYPSQQDTLHSLYTADGDGNFGTGGYSNPEVDALLAEADAADTIEETYEGYRAAQERILEDFPVVPTFGNRYLYVTSDRIEKLYSVSGSPLFSRTEVAA